jgi:hypothetical protein
VDSTVLMVLAVLGIVVVAAAIWYEQHRRRSRLLHERFGAEYDRTVRAEGDVRRAESVLDARARRVEKLHIRPLEPLRAAGFEETWRKIQAQFVDDPGGAVTQADRLIGEVMSDRGYPVADFEQRVADISVDHPDVVMNYRAAREIAQEHAHGEASTEDLRQAFVHYRALFKDLLETNARPAPSRMEAEPARRY